MRERTPLHPIRIVAVVFLVAALWLGAVEMFAHHHHDDFQPDNDCAMCQLVTAGVCLFGQAALTAAMLTCWGRPS